LATLVTEQGIVHYEVFGRGRPVVLLHGWLNSWNVWRGTIEALGGDFRLYAVDFFGFGDSGEGAHNYTVDTFSQLVEQFMDRMGITRAPLVGHSMGGTVSLMTALRIPDKVVKVGVVGSPIDGASLSMLLRIAAYQPWQQLARSNPRLFTPVQMGLGLFLRGYSRILSKDARSVGAMLTSDLNKLTVMPFLESIGTLRQTDLRNQLDALSLPVLGVYGAKDVLVAPNQADVLKKSYPSAEIAWYKDSGHFPMMDEPPRFYETMRTFLAS
jgi:pimeloyl-ACP methyl ester carboxylesterase